MPIEVKNIEWSETEQLIILKVPLKGAATKNVDIFSTKSYLKVSFPPYFYELALYAEIDEEKSKATISNGQVVFNLLKKENGLWYQEHSSKQQDKAFMTKLRAEMLEYHQKKEQLKTKERNAEKDRQRKLAVKEQMRLDAEQRKFVEESRRKEEREICEDIADWKRKESVKVPKKEELKEISNKTADFKEHEQKPDKSDKNEEMPAPRTVGNIKVAFTNRILPTPARESKLPEEEVWLEKLANMNKTQKQTSDTVDVEEMNPIWLKDKGNDFFKKGNHVAAINAYTSALVLDSNIPMLYSNRAACHLVLKQYKECIQDCTCALELFNPPVEQNLVSRCRAYARRGAAYFFLHEYVEALRDYESAAKLDPKNESLKTDAYKIRRIIQGKDSSD